MPDYGDFKETWQDHREDCPCCRQWRELSHAVNTLWAQTCQVILRNTASQRCLWTSLTLNAVLAAAVCGLGVCLWLK